MALDKTALKTSIVQIMTDMLARDVNAIDEFATRLSDAVDDYVKNATIVYLSGLVSATGGPVTGTFNGNIE